MISYQDWLKYAATEQGRVQMICTAIAQHKGTEMYRTAFDAEEYDCQRNVTILKYRKVLYTLTGKAVEDVYTPNHKICSNFFNRFTTQLNQYLLGNGVTFEDESAKERLGEDFDDKLQLSVLVHLHVVKVGNFHNACRALVADASLPEQIGVGGFLCA